MPRRAEIGEPAKSAGPGG